MKYGMRAGALLAGIILSGCATNLSKPTKEAVPAQALLKEFKSAEMKPVSLAPAFAESGANQKAKKKIDELLFAVMSKKFAQFKRVESFSGGDSKTLQITPVIKEIKFIGGGARFWAGALAGSSAVLMQVDYKDGSTGKVLANPEFYAQANAWGGAWSIGGTDNAMLERVVLDIATFTSASQ